MGDLIRHYLPFFHCDIFIETGTGIGSGIHHAVTFPFKELHTIEIIPELYETASKSITDPRIHFHLGDSIDILPKILPQIEKTDKILFWMDAHFPGTDFGIGGREYVFDEKNMPLKREIETICKNRDITHDSFIIDDLRLYEDGEYQTGNIDIGKPKSGVKFIEDLFTAHTIRRDYRDQGFLILTPKI